MPDKVEQLVNGDIKDSDILITADYSFRERINTLCVQSRLFYAEDTHKKSLYDG